MCRFALYLGEEILINSLVTEPTNSIIHQSFHSHLREEPLNGDGFGVAWYVPGASEPAVFKEVRPAWNSLNLCSLAKVTRTHCLMAHVRAASPGLPVAQLNCHPFSWRDLCLMHNGGIGGFLRMKRRLQAGLTDESFDELMGSTDSEHAFALFKDSFRGSAVEDPLERMAEALVNTLRRIEDLRREMAIEEGSALNLALTDGRRAVVSRFSSSGSPPSLFCHRGGRYICEEKVCRMVDVDQGVGAVLITSEPLSEDSGWTPVPENHLVLVGEDRSVELRPIV